ncbi:MAG: FkbM family methyltransferase [Nanoarchaeota archaeon]|nr:FkbM family methyltransferase [Nanoarchaeota archaeon]
MGLYHQISKLMPEGKLKNRFRNIFYKISNSITLGTKMLILNKERGIKGRFHKPLFVRYSDCLEELPGYVGKYVPQKGDVVVDAGAFVGNFAVYASKLVGPEGKVIAFEPEESNYRLLKRNIKLNKLKNVIVIKKGLWHKDDLLKFKTKGPESCLADFDKEENLSNTISVVSLDSFFKRNRIKKLDFVKMDIEGAEIRAIEGMKNLMQANKINFAIASYHIVEGKQTCIKLEKMFKEMGYKSNTGYPRHQTTYASK